VCCYGWSRLHNCERDASVTSANALLGGTQLERRLLTWWRDSQAYTVAVQLFHITTRAAWAAAQAGGVYEPASLGSEGFIHLSTERQWRATLARFFAGETDLILLTIDPAGLDVRFERADADDFPHLYGALPIAAVIAVEPI
jgi:uncharacterized protein (DUF952 family)